LLPSLEKRAVEWLFYKGVVSKLCCPVKWGLLTPHTKHPIKQNKGFLGFVWIPVPLLSNFSSVKTTFLYFLSVHAINLL
jgi:hypothetical protein